VVEDVNLTHEFSSIGCVKLTYRNLENAVLDSLEGPGGHAAGPRGAGSARAICLSGISDPQLPRLFVQPAPHFTSRPSSIISTSCLEESTGRCGHYVPSRSKSWPRGTRRRKIKNANWKGFR